MKAMLQTGASSWGCMPPVLWPHRQAEAKDSGTQQHTRLMYGSRPTMGSTWQLGEGDLYAPFLDGAKESKAHMCHSIEGTSRLSTLYVIHRVRTEP